MSRELEFGKFREDADGVVVEVRIPEDARYFEGHFPGSPILPGVAQIIALSEEPAARAWPDLGPAQGLRRVKFQKAIRPGDVLELRMSRKGPKVSFHVLKEGELCSKGTLVFRETDSASPA